MKFKRKSKSRMGMHPSDERTSFRTCYGHVEEFLAAGEAGDLHTKPFFFPVVSAATCTDNHLEVDQKASSVDTTWASVDTLSPIRSEGVLGRSLVSTLPNLVSTLPDLFCPKGVLEGH
ncbi:hypothetical protein Taro_023346 [Colocasia esculenta]|uniref:Uncharacterized protein n=1 Tax=Colocasia esculenta TaxID=4460 RepID=A0A843V4E8_COLES|nr:hypothetical protein [Colocasia esculenta]